MNQTATYMTKSMGLRQLFYLVLPQEANYPHFKQVPNYISISTPYFIGMILIEYVLCILLRVKRARVDDGISSLSAGIIQQVPKVMLKSLAFPLYFWVYENYRLFSLSWDSPFTWYMSFILMDFGYYVFHRLSHEIAIVWGAHQVHHSSEDYNLTTALRQSVFQHCFSDLLYVPLALLMPPSHFLIHNQLNTLYQFWIHTECIETLGPLEYVLNTPSHHRVHHGRNRYCIDKNYAGVLIIFDRMFGTFEAERKTDPVVYGLVQPLASWNPIWTQLCVFVALFKRVCHTQGVKNKLNVLLMGPGWTEGSPRLGNISDIPDIRGPQPRYEGKASNAVCVYGLIHFVMLVALFDSIVRDQLFLSAVYLCTSLSFILYSLVCLGFIFEDKREAVYFETSRLIALFVGSFLSERYEFLSANFALLLRFMIVISVGFWVKTRYDKKQKVE